MKVEFEFEGKAVVSDVRININMPLTIRDMHFTIRSLVVDGVDLYNSDEDEDCDLSDAIVYSQRMTEVVYNQLAA